MTEGLSFHKVCDNGNGSGALDIIFVHGLTGDPVGTWAVDGNDIASGYWPSWFCEDFPNVRVFTLGYPASVFGSWAKKEMTLFERAKNALESLASYKIGDRPIALITHSLGGLLAKQMLRTANESTDSEWKAIATSARLVAFLATPHTGAGLANVLHKLTFGFTSTYVQTLTDDTGQLDELNQSYRNFAPTIPITTLAYYEKHKYKGLLLVNPQSADPGVHGTTPIALDADHIAICKPINKEALVYRSVSRYVQRTLNACTTSSFGSDDYATMVADDRRDLLQKLIDAGREYEYSSANDHQSKFAQRYYKLGLHTEAKSKNDELLAEVEQRFQLHVFQNKILKKAGDDEIAVALQQHVIDAICKKYSGKENVSPTTVFRAIYFLTQQCHLSWNAP